MKFSHKCYIQLHIGILQTEENSCSAKQDELTLLIFQASLLILGQPVILLEVSMNTFLGFFPYLADVQHSGWYCVMGKMVPSTRKAIGNLHAEALPHQRWEHDKNLSREAVGLSPSTVTVLNPC